MPILKKSYLKVIGPVIVGIELTKLPRSEDYRPHFVIYPLWKSTLKEIFAYPILQKQFYDKKNFPLSIPYVKRQVIFNDAQNTVYNQLPLSLSDDVSWSKAQEILHDYSQKPPMSAAPNSFLQATLKEAELKIALYVSIEESKKILSSIKSRNWDTKHFEACGVNANAWFESLEEVLANRAAFLAQIELNRKEKKILGLRSSALTL